MTKSSAFSEVDSHLKVSKHIGTCGRSKILEKGTYKSENEKNKGTYIKHLWNVGL